MIPRVGSVSFVRTVAVVALALLTSRAARGDWKSLPRPEAGDIAYLAVDPVSSATVWAAVQSTDGGAASARIYRSTNAGEIWTRADAGIAAQVLRGIEIDSRDPAHLYAIGSSLFETRNSGRTWSPLSTPSLPRALARNAASGVLYLGTFSAGVWKSTDGGSNWTAAGSGADSRVNAVLSSEHAPSVVHAAGTTGVYRSADAGATWSLVLPGFAQALAADPSNPSILWAAGIGRVSRSADHGLTWTSVSTGGQATVRGLAVLPDSRRAWAAGDDGVFRTDDAGASWVRDESGLGDPAGLHAAAGRTQPQRVYLAAGAGAPYRRDVAPASCADSDTALCLKGRFQVTIAWRDEVGGSSGIGHARTLSSDSGTFWFFDAANMEIMVKVLDGTGYNGHHWVFFGALTNVAFELVVADTATGAVRTYVNPHGTMASRADIEAFGPEVER